MIDEKEIIPILYERKLSYLLRHNKDLRPQILDWATEMLTKAREGWGKTHVAAIETIIFQDRKALAVKRSKARDMKYASFREQFKQIQKKKWSIAQKSGKTLSANAFVIWFLKNKAKTVDIPYKNTNIENKLNQLAQANNREFKKAFANYS